LGIRLAQKTGTQGQKTPETCNLHRMASHDNGNNGLRLKKFQIGGKNPAESSEVSLQSDSPKLTSIPPERIL
jgi:hypothetical protein